MEKNKKQNLIIALISGLIIGIIWGVQFGMTAGIFWFFIGGILIYGIYTSKILKELRGK